MRQEHKSRVQEGDFEDEYCNRCVEKITRLRALIDAEEEKLFKALRNTAKSKL